MRKKKFHVYTTFTKLWPQPSLSAPPPIAPPPQRSAKLLHRCSSSSSDSNFEPNGAERANTRVIHKFTEFFSKGSGKKICSAMSPQKLKIQLYRWQIVNGCHDFDYF